MTRLLAPLPHARDLSVGLLLLLVVLLMILPMPTMLVDALIGLNFGVAVLLLTTAIYLASPLSLSSLPGIILVATIFRLALSVTTTRLILSEADAGDMVRTFGELVVAGNVIVGLVVFFIVTIVQFIVIAKGAERIAEVAARFTLDALPGKQMAIDAELRNGDIDNAEASGRRRLLEQESQFYGSMDGAMKFVKGDAIAGLIIIIVNLVGGLIIGTAQLGMPIGEAARVYSLLTVGDALISQIPALLIAVTAGVIVTRVKSDKARNLGADILSQIAADRQALMLAGLALLAMGLLPGFPTAILAVVASVFLGVSILAPRIGGTAEEAEEAAAEEAELEPLEGEEDATVEVAPDLVEPEGLAAARARARELGDAIAARTGLLAVSLGLRVNDRLDPGSLRVFVDGTAVHWAAIPEGAVFVPDMPDVLTAHEIPFRLVTGSGWTRRLEVPEDRADDVAAIGLPLLDRLGRALAEAETGLLRNLGPLIGIEETRAILSECEAETPSLTQEVQKAVPVQKIAEVFRRLLDERVPLAGRRRVLEALVEWAPVDQNPMALTEYCRVALRQHICARAAGPDRTIAAIVVERETEDALRAAVRDTNIGSFLVLNESQTAELLDVVREQIDRLAPKGTAPVLMTSMDVRRHLRAFLSRNSVHLDVLSFQELSDDYSVVPCSTLNLSFAGRGGTSRPASRTPAATAEPTDGKAVAKAGGARGARRSTRAPKAALQSKR